MSVNLLEVRFIKFDLSSIIYYPRQVRGARCVVRGAKRPGSIICVEQPTKQMTTTVPALVDPQRAAAAAAAAAAATAAIAGALVPVDAADGDCGWLSPEQARWAADGVVVRPTVRRQKSVFNGAPRHVVACVV